MNRRELLLMAGAGLLLPRAVGADEPRPTDRKLLVILCQGGWDPTRLFNPAFGNPNVSMEADAQAYTVGNLTIVDSPDRPTVRSWFDAHHERVAIINGFEVRSVTHERCLRLLLTGTGGDDADDWPSVIAAHGSVQRPLPYLVLSGPAFNAQYTNLVVRVGENGQLPDLLSGAAVSRPFPNVDLPSTDAAALADAALAERLATLGATAGPGAETALIEGYARALDDVRMLQAGGGIDLASGEPESLCGGVMGQLQVALDALQGDHARAAMVQYLGNCGPNWDQHSDIAHQSICFEELFQHLDMLMDELQTRVGVDGGPLLDEVTVIVCSEMGRHPIENEHGGKDHWTHTSCMLFGAGVRGNLTVGAYDDTTFGRPVDLASGQPDGAGVSLLPPHIGATLFALVGVDPALAGADPITAVLA